MWLTADQQSVWRAYLLGAPGSTSVWTPICADRPRPGEYEILVTLEARPTAAVRMSELADAVHQSRSRLTHTITRMEGRGLVERTSCPTDRRGVWAG